MDKKSIKQWYNNYYGCDINSPIRKQDERKDIDMLIAFEKHLNNN